MPDWNQYTRREYLIATAGAAAGFGGMQSVGAAQQTAQDAAVRIDDQETDGRTITLTEVSSESRVKIRVEDEAGNSLLNPAIDGKPIPADQGSITVSLFRYIKEDQEVTVSLVPDSRRDESSETVLAEDSASVTYTGNIPAGIETVADEEITVAEELIEDGTLIVPYENGVQINGSSTFQSGRGLLVRVSPPLGSDEELFETTQTETDENGDWSVTFDFREFAERGLSFELEISPEPLESATTTIESRIPEGETFQLTRLETTDSIDAGDELRVTIGISYAGENERTETITVELGDAASTALPAALEPGESTTETVTLETEGVDVGEYTLAVSGSDSTETTTVTVEEPEDGSGETDQATSGDEEQTTQSTQAETSESDEENTGGNDSEGGSGDDSGPGFGVTGTLASLGGVGYLLKRRLGGTEDR